MDDFLVVLAIALAIIAVFGFFFISSPLPGVNTNVTITEFDVGKVGFSSSTPSREINIGEFVAGLYQEDVIRNIPVFDVSANIFASDKKKYDVVLNKDVLNSLDKISITFNVKETNEYSNLVLEWNGEKVLDKKADGLQSVKIEKEKLKETNILDVYTTASSYFWASTAYKIEDFKVNQEYADAKIAPFTISLSEYETLDKGELDFFVSDRTSIGELIVKLNGKQIYSQYPDRIVKIKVDSIDDFVIGNNILSFSAKTGVFELDEVKMNLFSLSKAVTKQKNFNLNQDDFNKLNKELINLVIDVKYVDKPGSLIVELNGNRIQIDLREAGIKTISFDRTYMKKGENTILFKTTGNFEINRIKIVQ